MGSSHQPTGLQTNLFFYYFQLTLQQCLYPTGDSAGVKLRGEWGWFRIAGGLSIAPPCKRQKC